ncbi:CopG family ribbon-helix-helix protein [Klebsiella michiganensis]|uniref:CopG family ribbon-helix-helix protein n=1 Tax=Klebsiella michiganensis TaxID=1134687 RepID=UPI001CCAD5D7|nr:ribbon-helix-helix domain-containing protein [Klebsiella michiganensis]MCW9619277.1 ribbon-helix-helix domain-containing protein [Klebsiella michiganensis]
MGVMSVRLNNNLSTQLEALSKATGCSKSWLANQAIEDYVAREAWQVSEIEKAIQEADEGDFTTSDEVACLNIWE